MNPSLNANTPPWKTDLALAQAQAQAADFKNMHTTCERITDAHKHEAAALLDVGALLLNFGFISDARKCFERVEALSPNDLRPKLNLANCARDAGDHQRANDLYVALQAALPNNPMIRRNVLVSAQYNPAISNTERLDRAIAWGDWAIAQAGGPRPRPPLRFSAKLASSASVPLRVGYVSADFCQHTVGLSAQSAQDARCMLGIVGLAQNSLTQGHCGVATQHGCSGQTTAL